MLTEFIAGSNGNRIVASPKLWEELGRYLNLIHRIPVTGFGEKLDDILPHVIDWGSARAHIVPHHDPGVILEESLQENSEEFAALLNGYGIGRDAFNKIKSEIADLRLLEAVDKLRWALDKAPDWAESHKSRLIKLLPTI